MACFILSAPVACLSCIAIGYGGNVVKVTSETAIIVWDSKAHIERFTRSADFATSARDLGFLVPTPSQPTLVEAKDEAFAAMSEIVRARLARKEEEAHGGAVAAAVAANPVVSITDVGGYEATVLSLASPSAVEGWLKQHKYPENEAAAQWLAVYEQKHWFLTAFRVNAKSGAAGLKPVQMTFHADAPFYPYREPSGASADNRTLRVFFLGDAGVEGQVGGEPWAVKPEISVKLTSEEIARLQPSMPGIALAQVPWLTSFLDASSPRVGTDDIYFSESHSLAAASIYGAIGSLIGFIVWMRIRRRPSS